MAYILKRIDGKGGYVSPSGYKNPYTMNPVLARRYSTKEEAELDRCKVNEIVCDLGTEMNSALAR